MDAFSPILRAYIAGSIIGQLALISSGGADRSTMLTLVLAGALVDAAHLGLIRLKYSYFDHKREYMELDLKHELIETRSHMQLEQLELPEMRDKYTYASNGVTEVFWYMRQVMDLASSILGILGTIVVIFSTVPWAALALVLLPVITVYFRYKNYMKFRGMWDSRRSHRIRASYIGNMLSGEQGILEVRLYGLLKKMIGLWRKEFTSSIEVRRKDETRSMKLELSTTIFESGVGVAVDIWLVFQVFALNISVAIFEQTRRLVSTYVALLSVVSRSLSAIVTDAQKVNDYRSFAVGDYSSEENPEARRIGMTPTRISARGASFSYPNSTSAAIDGVDLDIKKGQSVAIVGVNGAGKTTLIKTLLGVYQLSGGVIEYDGLNLKDIRKDSLYKHMATLFQDFEEYAFLNVAQSVSVSDKSPDIIRVRKSLRQVGLLKFFESQPKGLESNLGYVEEDGIKLSGGQWQRLAIARALYKEAPILILDEPTSAIDAKSEQEIMDTIFRTYKDKVLIATSHRLSTVSRADVIVVVKGGKIVESGSHKELFKPGTAYHDLFKRQAV